MAKFAKEQMLKYGWAEGKGLGKNEDGITEALKPTVKINREGLGYKRDVENWWEELYNNTAKSIENKPCLQTSYGIYIPGHVIDKTDKDKFKQGFMEQHLHNDAKSIENKPCLQTSYGVYIPGRVIDKTDKDKFKQGFMEQHLHNDAKSIKNEPCLQTSYSVYIPGHVIDKTDKDKFKQGFMEQHLHNDAKRIENKPCLQTSYSIYFPGHVIDKTDKDKFKQGFMEQHLHNDPLINANYFMKSKKEETTNDSVDNPFSPLTDEQLYAACSGRTAHKTARHGHTLSGKLGRIAQQDALFANNDSMPHFYTYSHMDPSRDILHIKKINEESEEEIENEVDINENLLHSDINNPIVRSKSTRKKHKKRINQLAELMNACNLKENSTKSEHNSLKDKKLRQEMKSKKKILNSHTYKDSIKQKMKMHLQSFSSYRLAPVYDDTEEIKESQIQEKVDEEQKKDILSQLAEEELERPKMEHENLHKLSIKWINWNKEKKWMKNWNVQDCIIKINPLDIDCSKLKKSLQNSNPDEQASKMNKKQSLCYDSVDDEAEISQFYKKKRTGRKKNMREKKQESYDPCFITINNKELYKSDRLKVTKILQNETDEVLQRSCRKYLQKKKTEDKKNKFSNSAIIYIHKKQIEEMTAKYQSSLHKTNNNTIQKKKEHCYCLKPPKERVVEKLKGQALADELNSVIKNLTTINLVEEVNANALKKKPTQTHLMPV